MPPVKHNSQTNSIEINDGLKTVYLVLKSVMVLNILMAIANLSTKGFDNLDFIGYSYFLVGLLSIGALYFLSFKKATDRTIPIDKISCLREKKSLFGRNFYSLKLKNGKVRDLTQVKSTSDVLELKKLLTENGIS